MQPAKPSTLRGSVCGTPLASTVSPRLAAGGTGSHLQDTGQHPGHLWGFVSFSLVLQEAARPSQALPMATSLPSFIHKVTVSVM